MTQQVHVFIGTKAQYIKTAPLLRLMDEQGIPYRLIDSGQHGALSRRLRSELAVREPDMHLGSGRDIDSIPQGVGWTLGVARRLFTKRWLRETLFGGRGGVCVVHGDTQSTLLAALMARRAGLRVAHLEAGLRSRNLLHPFPEELIRLLVMHASHVLFAPDSAAVHNLEGMGLADRVVRISANTSVEALRYSLAKADSPVRSSAIVTMHRLENLKRRGCLDGLAGLAERIVSRWPVTFVLHGPTRAALKRSGWLERLAHAGVDLLPLQPHDRFTAMLNAAPLVVTDGGSVQEECALLGVPTLLWRTATERPDGLGRNVVLSQYDPQVVENFLERPDDYRCDRIASEARPSEEVIAVLLRLLANESLVEAHLSPTNAS